MFRDVFSTVESHIHMHDFLSLDWVVLMRVKDLHMMLSMQLDEEKKKAAVTIACERFQDDILPKHPCTLTFMEDAFAFDKRFYLL